MSIPQFDPNHVAAHSSSEDHMYRAELSSRDPMSSVLADNPEIYFVPPKRKSEWGQWEFKPGSYYDTTTGDKHPYWKDKDLPQASKDIERLRADMRQWGYCKIEEDVPVALANGIDVAVLTHLDAEDLPEINAFLVDADPSEV